MVARSLDQSINDALTDVNQEAVDLVRSHSALGPHEPAGHAPEERDSGPWFQDEDFAALTSSQLLGGRGDVFVIVLDPQGRVIANPRDVPVEALPLKEAAAQAGEEGSHREDMDAEGGSVRLLTVPVEDAGAGLASPEAGPAGFVVTGQSIEEREAALRGLVVLLLIAAAAGLGLAGIGGLWVGELAIRPVRRSFQRQREFVADASHELRTPIAVIRTNAEALTPRVAEGDREALDDIVAEAEHMGRLVTDLLTLARSDQGALEVDRSPLDMYDVIASVGRAAMRLAEGRGLEFTVSPAHAVVLGDPERLRELLLILVDNAVKYTGPGGKVTLSAGQEDGRVHVVVQDTGIGIPPEHLPRVFDRFYRVDKARSRALGGLGLGLSIAQAIAKAHGGSVELRSAPGRGTRATLALPLASSTV
jgi:signal transduction histidine kinase